MNRKAHAENLIAESILNLLVALVDMGCIAKTVSGDFAAVLDTEFTLNKCGCYSDNKKDPDEETPND